MVAFNNTSTVSFSGVTAGETATISLPPSGLYESLQIEYKKAGTLATVAQMIADITEIRVVVNGKVQRRYSAKQLFMLLGLKNHAVNDGFLNIFFAEPSRRSAEGEDSLGWGMADVQTFEVQIDLDDAAGAVTLKCKRNHLPVNNVNMGAIVKIKRHNIPVSSTGEIQWQSLPRLDRYYALHAQSTDIDEVTVEIDNTVKFDNTTLGNSDRIEQHGLTPQAGYFHILADVRGRIKDFWSMQKPNGNGGFVPVDEVLVKFEMNAATSFDVIVEQVGLRD
jgi:hypothetical protein